MSERQLQPGRQAKTAGNLTETEEKLLTTALANLRPLYEKAVG